MRSKNNRRRSILGTVLGLIAATAFCPGASSAQSAADQSAAALTATTGDADAPVLTARTEISSQALQEDFAILKRAYLELHPSLYRYQSPSEIEEAFEQLKSAWSEDRSYAQAYLDLSALLAEIQCGHTYANFFNQPKDVREALFDLDDKLPLTFRFIGEDMVVDHDVSGADIPKGSRITHIDGVRVRDILEKMLGYVKGDGSRRSPRIYDLQVSGAGRYEPFDIYFPLLNPPADGKYQLTYRTAKGRRKKAIVDPVSRKTRQDRLAAAGIEATASKADLWKFRIETVNEQRIGYLKIGTFAMFNSPFDWRDFMETSFATVKEEQIDKLVLDLRGNGGGEDRIRDAVLSAFADRPLEGPPIRNEIAFIEAPDDLRPYLGTWDKSFFDWSGRATEAPDVLGEGRYLLGPIDGEAIKVAANSNAFDGELVALFDRAASSATFTLAGMLKSSGRATLIGEETGGNQRGISGGAIFFLNLPNSRLEADLPIIQSTPLLGESADLIGDDGIEPDIRVDVTIEDIIEGRDPVLAEAFQFLGKSPQD
ncbi:MAG: S41 family peptidase [Pseudomonadota bacterium]